MLNCNPAPTPVDTKAKLSASDESLASDAPFYCSIVGALQYLTLTRPELQYAVQQVCLHMHAPRDAHWAAVKQILRYVCGTMGYGLSLHASPSTSTDLVAYSDADWAGCPDTRRSTSGYRIYLGSSLVSWSSKRQPTVSRSSAEAEYRAVANAMAECTWLRQLLSELSCPVDKATVVFCENVLSVYLSANPIRLQRISGWRLSYLRVPVPPLPPREPERSAEIGHRRRYLPSDLRADPAYVIDSNTWRT
nr:uncharacterized mitochondrial protein AtMg00810-like [Lolium perenne]